MYKYEYILVSVVQWQSYRTREESKFIYPPIRKQQKNPQKSLGGERKKIETLQYSDLTNKVNKLKSIGDIFSKDTLNNGAKDELHRIIKIEQKINQNKLI